jgi:hypothetical protein
MSGQPIEGVGISTEVVLRGFSPGPLTEFIGENFSGHDADVSWVTVCFLCEKYPEIGRILGVTEDRG